MHLERALITYHGRARLPPPQEVVTPGGTGEKESHGGTSKPRPAGPVPGVLFLRRLRLPLQLAPRTCSCHGYLDALGDHRSLECAVARVCREVEGGPATLCA